MKKVLLLVIAIVIGISAYAQIETPVKWSYAAKRVSATEAVVFLKASIQDGWHIYALNLKDGGPIKTEFAFAPSKDYVLDGKTSQPKPLSKFENAFKMNVTYFEKEVVFQQKIKIKSAAASVVKGKLSFQTCNDHKCLPPEDLDFSIPLGK